MYNINLLQQAIDYSPLIPKRQGNVLKIICSKSYSISAKEIEELLGLTRPSISFSLKMLLKRNFITRVRDNIYLYCCNKERIEEIIKRYLDTKKVSNT